NGAENGADDAGDPAPSLACPAVSSRAGTIISLTLDRLQHRTTPETLTLIETDLTRTAATADPDFLARVARRWSDTIDADGTEPSEEALRHTQGAFIRKPRHGLHHLEIFATTDQYEHLLTVMNTATNPRTTTPTTSTTATSSSSATSSTCRIDTDIDGDTGGSTATGTSTGQDRWADADADVDVELDRRTRSQKQLDGIIGALKAALTTN
ncbi:HNH endonuclease, partial [Arthrobacter sp. HMWF013]